MTAGITFEVAQDVRLRPVRRGPRPLLGPRLTALLSGETAAKSMEIQELTARWEDLSGGGRIVEDASGDPSIKAPEPSKVGQQSHLDRLMTIHRATATRARRPILPEPASVDHREVRRELRAAAVEHVFALRIPTRRQLVKAADQRVDDEVTRRIALRNIAHAEDQAEADQWWQHLCDGHATFAFNRLLTAFEASDLPATVTAVADRAAHMVMSIDTAEMLIGQREPVRSGQAGVSLAIMSPGRRNKLYVQAMSSGIVGVAAHALAVVPGIDIVNIAVVGLTHATGPAVLAMAALPRAAVLPAGKDVPIIDDLVLAAQRGSVRMTLNRDSLEDAPRPLDNKTTSVAGILAAVEESRNVD
ncbi:MAG: hypothetical protein WD358_05365 [Nitriliruptoraceae bacterium]